MRRLLAAVVVALAVLGTPVTALVAPRPVVVNIGHDRFDITGEGNTLTGLRHAPVPYESVSEVAAAVREPPSLAASVRLTRAAPPQVVDYIWCVTSEGVLVVGQQVRSLDGATGEYVFTEGDIKRAYPALEGIVPWTWIVDIPLGREVALLLEVRATARTFPVRSVTVLPKVMQ
jgi:hypothetical protein